MYIYIASRRLNTFPETLKKRGIVSPCNFQARIDSLERYNLVHVTLSDRERGTREREREISIGIEARIEAVECSSFLPTYNR